MATRRPTNVAPAAASTGEIGNGMCCSSASLDRRNPLTPASTSCASEICPTNPVSTTNDSEMTMPTNVLVIPNRPFGVASRSSVTNVTAIAIGPTTSRLIRPGVGANGSRPELIAPRVGSASPRRNKTSTITTNGRSSPTPGVAMVPECGNHDFVPAKRMTGLAIEMRNAARAVMPNDERLPTSTALSAGITSSVIVTGSTLESADAATIPNIAASIVDSTQLVPANMSGEKPSTTAPFSFSDAARVARPKRANRNNAHSAAVTMSTRITTKSCSRVNWTPNGNFHRIGWVS